MICCVQVSSFALSSLSLKCWECECECECPPRRCWSFRCLPGCPRSDVTPVHPLFRNAYNNGRSRSGYNRKGIRPWNAVSLLSPINRNYSIKKKSEVHPVPLKIYIPKWYVWSKQKIQRNPSAVAFASVYISCGAKEVSLYICLVQSSTAEEERMNGAFKRFSLSVAF